MIKIEKKFFSLEFAVFYVVHKKILKYETPNTIMQDEKILNFALIFLFIKFVPTWMYRLTQTFFGKHYFPQQNNGVLWSSSSSTT